VPNEDSDFDKLPFSVDLFLGWYRFIVGRRNCTEWRAVTAALIFSQLIQIQQLVSLV